MGQKPDAKIGDRRVEYLSVNKILVGSKKIC